jgi:putative acetyltransferase
MPEFAASGPGYAIHDAEVDDMPTSYRAPRSAYFVVVRGEGKDAVVVGGGGFAPLTGGDETTCELRKMYFYTEARGLGLGQDVLDRCLEGARRAGFERMYLETLARMPQARALYAKNGFAPVPRPLGATGHFGCDAYFVKKLAP